MCTKDTHGLIMHPSVHSHMYTYRCMHAYYQSPLYLYIVCVSVFIQINAHTLLATWYICTAYYLKAAYLLMHLFIGTEKF